MFHQLSPQSGLVQINTHNKTNEYELDFVSIIVINFASEFHQIHITKLMSVRNYIMETFDGSVIEIVNGEPHLLSLNNSKILFESAVYQNHLVTHVRPVCFAQYVNDDGETYDVTIVKSDDSKVLRGTKEIATGKIWYFPSIEPA